MLLRLFLKLIKPSDQELLRKSNGSFVRCRIGIYRFILKQLANSYFHYAASDTVVIGNGAIRITWEIRDMEFEEELSRNKIIIKSPLTDHAFPMSLRKNKSRKFFHYFKFDDLLRIAIDGEELVIRHNDCYTIDGTVDAGLKCTDKRDGFAKSVISVRRAHSGSPGHDTPAPQRHQAKECKSAPDDNKRSPRRIFDKEKEISPIFSPSETVQDTDTDRGSQPLKKNGFEIDTDF